MQYIIKIQLSNPSDQNKCMSAWTKVLEHDHKMQKIHGSLHSQANLMKTAREERKKRQEVTHQACQAIFQSKNAIADWNLADGRNFEDMKMDMYADHKMAQYAAWANPEPLVAEMTYVAAGMVIDIAQKQGSPILLSQATQNAVLQYLQTATDKDIITSFEKNMKTRVIEDSMYVSDPKFKVSAKSTEIAMDPTGRGEWVHLELSANPARDGAGEDQQVVAGKLAGTCVFNSHQDLLKGRQLGDCEDMAATIAGYGHVFGLDKNVLCQIQRNTLASKFMPDDYKLLGDLLCCVTARVHTAFNPSPQNQNNGNINTIKMKPTQIKEQLVKAASSKADKTNLTSTEKQPDIIGIACAALLARQPVLDSMDAVDTSSVNLCDPKMDVEKYTQAWQSALTSTSKNTGQNPARKPAGHAACFKFELSNQRSCEVADYNVHTFEVNKFHVLEGTAEANEAQERDTGVSLQVCLAGRQITPLRANLDAQLKGKRIGKHLATNIQAALHSKELEQASLNKTNEHFNVMNTSAIQLYSLCVPADAPDLPFATKYNFYQHIICAGPGLNFCMVTTKGNAEPGACLFRTFDNCQSVAVQTEMKPTEEEAYLYLGAIHGLFTLQSHEIPRKPFTPLQMRMTTNTALCPIMGDGPFLNSGMIIRSDMTPDETGEMKNLKAIAEHVHREIDPNAQIQLSTFLNGVVVRVKGA